MTKQTISVGAIVLGLAVANCDARVADLGGTTENEAATGTSGNASVVAGDGASGSCTAHAQTAYRLVPRRKVTSPLPNPTGIAYDGQMLWVLAVAGFGDGGSPPTLVRFDPDTLVVDRTFVLSALINYGTTVGGITWDGQVIWISLVGDVNSLVRVDPLTGEVNARFDSPTTYGPSDLDFDGRDLWLSTGTGDIYRIDPASGSLEQHMQILPQADGRDDGIAFRSCELWVGEFFGGMEVHDPSSGGIVGMATNADGSVVAQSELGGSCFVGDQLVIASRAGITYYDTEIVP
jgi:hypothetical protein